MPGDEAGGGSPPVVGQVPSHIKKPSWKYRRIIIFTTLVLNALFLITVTVGWLMGVKDTHTIQIISGALIAQSTAVIGSYVFGAAFEDINIAKLFGKGGFDMDEVIDRDTRRI